MYAFLIETFSRSVLHVCEQQKALVRLRLCAGLPEPFRVACVISTFFSCAGSYMRWYIIKIIIMNDKMLSVHTLDTVGTVAFYKKNSLGDIQEESQLQNIPMTPTKSKQTKTDCTQKVYVKIPRKCHDHEAQPSRGTKRRRDDITKTRLFKYIENFTTKNWKFSDKKTLIFFIFLLKT